MKKFLTRNFCANFLNQYSKVLTNGRNNIENLNIDYNLNDVSFVKYIIAQCLNENKSKPLMQKILKQYYKEHDNKNIKELNDIAQQYLDHYVSLGAYTDSAGNAFCIQNLANSIQQRDGVAIDKKNITTTASSYILFNMIAVCGNKDDKGALLTPQVKDPVYLQLMKNNNISDYTYQDLQDEQQLLEDLQKNLNQSRKDKKRIFGVFLSSPHSVSGRAFEKQTLEKIMEFCHSNNLMLIVDESYQLCQLPEKVQSVRKLMHNHQNQNLRSELELITFCNSYKGFIPNAIFQGAVSTMENLDVDVQAIFLKLQSMMLCCATTQQIYTDLMFQLHYGKGLFSEQLQNAYKMVINNSDQLIQMYRNSYLQSLKDFKGIKMYRNDCGHNTLIKFDFCQDDVELSELIHQKSSIRTQPGSQYNFPGSLLFSNLQKYSYKNLDQMENAIQEIYE